MKFYFVVFAAVVSLTACTQSKYATTAPAVARIPQVTGPAVSSEASAWTAPSSVRLTNGAQIDLQRYQGQTYFEVEGVLNEDSFTRLLGNLSGHPETERNSVVKEELERVFEKLRKAKAIHFKSWEKVGYFTFLLPYQPDLLAPLKTLKFRHHITFNPVVIDRDSLAQVKAISPLKEGLVPRKGPRDHNTGFSGLSQMNALEFTKLAEATIGAGAKVNGDSVMLGVTDTGITLNHPTFLSSDRKTNRIVYMKDFTREGRVYFNPAAKLIAKPVAGTEEELSIDAQVIRTPRLPNIPAADQFNEVADMTIQVSAELRSLLLTPGTTARLGALSEQSLQSEEEALDLNNNGETDDQLWMILVSGATPAEDRLYVDVTGTGDFRNARALRDWNVARESVPVFAERFGFHIAAEKLPSEKTGAEVLVRSVSLVGFDPGNHGTHVAGIAAGSRTISNDAEDTLARGVAPDAKILMNRVCANNGGCNATAAIIDLAVNGKAQVINMSLGGLSPFNDGYGVQETVVNRLVSQANVLMVISAGNSGPGRQTVGSPSSARLSLSVGAAASVGMVQRQYQWPAENLVERPEDDREFMMFFSSRGPTAAGGFKPNLSAPGTELSAIRLNSAPGSRGGLDVYWGTSMSAPAATGAYALLLDAIQKYNDRYPERPLTTDARVLRMILIETARPFDVSRLDPITGKFSAGKYTLIDQGTGMIDLVAAWKKVLELRNETLPSAVIVDGKPVNLEYRVLTTLRNPSGISYDGSRASSTEPMFGTGLYLSSAETQTLYTVAIERALPEQIAAGDQAGDATVQLLTSADEFVLKTTIYGSEKTWLKAGVMEELNCSASDTGNLAVIGRGVDIVKDSSGGASLNPLLASALNICVDRQMIMNELPAGDHGALIAAYRVVGNQLSSVPSFYVPVYLQVPHRTLSGSTAYDISGTVKSFGVNRGYVRIPQGTSVVQVTLEVPALKKGPNGLPLPGEKCSGVELMALQGDNITPLFPSRREARVSNCDNKGSPIRDDKRVIRFIKTNPAAGTWDVHVFGSYRFAESAYRLRVDYITASSSVAEITGNVSALNGTLDFTVQEASMPVTPDAAKSSYLLEALSNSVASEVTQNNHVIVENPLGKLRIYPTAATKVTVTTGGSAGNDLDLTILECPITAESAQDPNCERVASSGGATDEESATFTPVGGRKYAVRVDGYDVKGSGSFTSNETIYFSSDRGEVSLSGRSPLYNVSYSVPESVVAASQLLTSPLFRSGDYEIQGSLTIKTADELTLYSVPVKIKH